MSFYRDMADIGDLHGGLPFAFFETNKWAQRGPADWHLACSAAFLVPKDPAGAAAAGLFHRSNLAGKPPNTAGRGFVHRNATPHKAYPQPQDTGCVQEAAFQLESPVLELFEARRAIGHEP